MSTAKVCMFVYNNCTHDARVLKEAKTLADAGYEVRIIAVLDKNTVPYEKIDGFKIIRVEKNPIHYRVLQTLRHPSLAIKKLAFWLMGIPVKLLAYIFLLFFGKPLRKKRELSPFSAKTLAWKLRHLSADFLHRALAHLKRRHHIAARAFLKGLRLSKKALRLSIVAYRKATRVVYKVLVSHGIKKILMFFHKPLCFWDYYRRSYRIVKRDPADIYHAHDLNTLPVAWWAKKNLGGKLVYDSHELFVERNRLKDATELTKRLMHCVEKQLTEHANLVITINDSYAKTLSGWYQITPPYVIKNVPYKHAFNKSLDLKDILKIDRQEAKLVIYSGAITFGRGLENVIASLAYMPRCHFVMLGYGHEDYKRWLRDLAQKHSVEDRVTFWGPVAANNVIAYVSGADLGVAPILNTSLSYYLCLPNKLFEYIAAGIPVAASNFPELRKIVLGHQLGEVFDPEDPRDIARAIDFILSDPERYRRMKENARRTAQTYNWENESRKLLKIYAELTKERA